MPTATITTRTGKGSALTQSEMDTNLTNLKSAVEDAADVDHTHIIDDVDGLQDALDAKVGTGDSRLSDSRTPVTHSHTPDQITGMAMYIAASGLQKLTAGTATVTSAAWAQDGGSDCIMMLNYARGDGMTNQGLLSIAETTSGNTEFIINSSNESDENFVHWIIFKRV